MQVKSKHFLLVLLLALCLCWPCVSQENQESQETMYLISESELVQLEMNLKMQKEQVEGLKIDLITLNHSLHQANLSYQELEKEKQIYKWAGIGGGIVLFFAGFLIGYKCNWK